VNISDGKSHQVALYLLDWDNQGRSESVSILDAASGNPLTSPQTVSNFVNGTYLIWTVSGHVTIMVTPISGPNCVVSGIFFGGSGAPPPVAPPTTGAATWVKADLGTSSTGTRGGWMGTYGSQGYSLANAGQSISIPATFAIANQGNYTWAVDPTGDPRALETDNHGDTIAACWFVTGTFTFDLNLEDGNTHQVALYVMDWDSKGRAETISITDSSGNPLDTRAIPSNSGPTSTGTTGTNFVDGTYLIWNISGHVTISVALNAGPNAVVSGVFIDP
jgi:hypothetical protein